MTREEAIEEIVQRLVEYYHPERIYLFGSSARGDCQPDSDLDFCVVLPDNAPDKLMRGGEIYRKLSGLGYSKDIIPWRSTHALKELYPDILAIDTSLAPTLTEADSLSEYAWRFRYPGAPYEPERAEAEIASETAETTVREIERRLPAGV